MALNIDESDDDDSEVNAEDNGDEDDFEDENEDLDEVQLHVFQFILICFIDCAFVFRYVLWMMIRNNSLCTDYVPCTSNFTGR